MSVLLLGNFFLTDLIFSLGLMLPSQYLVMAGRVVCISWLARLRAACFARLSGVRPGGESTSSGNSMPVKYWESWKIFRSLT